MPNLRLQNISADPILTSVVRGYTAPERLVYSEIFPVIPVDKENGKIRTFGKEYFRTYNAGRAIHGPSNVGKGLDSSKIPYSLDEREISIPIDYREEAESEDALKAEYAELAMRNIQLGLEEEVAATLQNTATYTAGHTEALTSTDQFSDSACKPVSIINDAKSTVSNKIGVQPNTLVLSDDSFKALKENPSMVELIKYSQKGIVTMDLMKELFEVENIIIADTIITDASDNFVNLYNACAMLFYIAPQGQRSKRDASFGYTLQLKGFPKGDEWQEAHLKVRYVRATTIQKQMILMREAGYLFTNTVA